MKAHTIDSVAAYVGRGRHAFIACDSSYDLCEVASRLVNALRSKLVAQIHGNQIRSVENFAEAVAKSCSDLQAKLGTMKKLRLPLTGAKVESTYPSLSIATNLTATMRIFNAADSQGFLVIRNIDHVVALQNSIEIEGPMRSAMQRHNDIAIVVCGSNNVINKLAGESDRPFYMSFRIFRISLED